MKLITTANAGEYSAWFAKALVDDQVWPYLSMTPRYLPYKVEDDDWERRIIMDDAGFGLCIVGFSRDGERAASVLIWILNTPTRAVIAASLLRDAIMFCSRYDVKSINSACHESNEASRRLHQKFYGEPWGIEPEGAWNGALRKWEGLYRFKRAAASLEIKLIDSSEARAA